MQAQFKQNFKTVMFNWMYFSSTPTHTLTLKNPLGWGICSQGNSVLIIESLSK